MGEARHGSPFCPSHGLNAALDSPARLRYAVPFLGCRAFCMGDSNLCGAQ